MLDPWLWLQAVDGALDGAKHAVDNAVSRIRQEVRLQKQKSDSLCRLKTAHNWREEKEENVEDNYAPTYFWRYDTTLFGTNRPWWE